MKYAIIVDEENKLVNVGSGTDEKYYQSIGMTLMDVEQGYDGRWYVKGYAPEKPTEMIASEVRAKRDTMLADTDKFMIADYPIEDDERELYRQYRQYLRNLPSADGFPEVEMLTFKQWNNAGNEGA